MTSILMVCFWFKFFLFTVKSINRTVFTRLDFTFYINSTGYTFQITLKGGYLSGGAGYTFSRETLKRMVSKMRENATFCPIQSTMEDIQVSTCLENVGVIPGESRDKFGRERFHAFKYEAHWTMIDPWVISVSNQPVKNVNLIFCSSSNHLFKIYLFFFFLFKFYFVLAFVPISQKGSECCSDSSITFHYVDSKTMYHMHHLIYRIKPFTFAYSHEDIFRNP
jgi:glycoprotein-N-acetylgalactosamine 3-beta-galactosyltransferase